MAIVTSPENHRNLARYREISRRLALAEGLTDDLARLLTREDASPVVVVDPSVLGGATSIRQAVRAIRSVEVNFLLRGRVRADDQGLRVTASMVATHDLSHV